MTFTLRQSSADVALKSGMSWRAGVIVHFGGWGGREFNLHSKLKTSACSQRIFISVTFNPEWHSRALFPCTERAGEGKKNTTTDINEVLHGVITVRVLPDSEFTPLIASEIIFININIPPETCHCWELLSDHRRSFSCPATPAHGWQAGSRWAEASFRAFSSLLCGSTKSAPWKQPLHFPKHISPL